LKRIQLLLLQLQRRPQQQAQQQLEVPNQKK